MTLPVTLIGTPIVTARQWTTGLAPRGGGGWSFVCQSWLHGEDVPTEWVIVNLESATYQIVEGPNKIYANSNNQIASENTGYTTTNQIRASNGRIFFLESSDSNVTGGIGDRLNIAYYDPSDELVHQLPELEDSTGNRHAITYSNVFNVDGSVLYCGTQAAISYFPIVYTVDPDTLAQSIIGEVGQAASANPKYAYYLARDVGNDLLYVAVGQDPWEVVAIDVTDGSQTVLATTTTGTQAIAFDAMANGWRCTVIDDGVLTLYWMADGALEAYPGSGAPSGGARTVTPYSNPLTDPPTIDWSQGVERVLYRPNGETGVFTLVEYEVSNKASATLESMTPLMDGTVLGNAEQYLGFYRMLSGELEWYGEWPQGLSSPIVLQVNSSLVYMAGYPNGALYAYDPSAAWSPSSDNPASIGEFHTSSGVKYTYYLQLVGDRLYQAGRRERDSSGSGIGYYDTAAETFTGETAAPLDNLIPRGFIVCEEAERVVFSGEILSGGDDAELVVYDLDLNQLDTYLVGEGIQNTGELYATSDPSVIVGVTNDSPYYIYRFNVLTGAVTDLDTLGAAVGAGAYRASDRSLWVMLGTTLSRIDLDTLDVRSVQTIADVTLMAWAVDDSELFITKSSDLYERGRVERLDPYMLTPRASDGSAAPPPNFFDEAISTLNEICTELGIDGIDPEILTPSATSGSASSLSDFFDVVIAKVNEALEEAAAAAQIDPSTLTPLSVTGSATSAADFYDLLIDRINALTDWL